ncbi:hypothetical protein [Borrelia sp. HM]|uniref:hypothetical protein n=1 Tax=Borrelia sp. HM TaxID=1882662 RepID=UPI001C791FB8|nr:hypothetical protein [Borrelia sp. HM]BCR21955.1 hypothetical protein BKFM_00532 [Borrelia sp. HM]
MKNILAMLILLANYQTSQASYESQNLKNSPILNGNQTITYCNKEEISCVILNIEMLNDNSIIKINTQDKNFSYNLPKIINKEKELTIEIKINNIKSIDLSNAKIKNSNAQTTAKARSQKLKILIDQNEYSIKFNLAKNMFPILGFKAKEVISSPMITSLDSEKESQKIVLSNVIKYTSLENENDEIKFTRNNNMIQIVTIGYINMNTYYDINKPINSDLKFILNYKKSNYRRNTFELFNLISEPNIYILKFKNLKYQSLMLKRIAFFTEKKEFRGILLSNNELENKIGWRGHDYRLQDIIIFFNTAQKSNIKLNQEEIILKNLIILNKLAYMENNILKIKDKSINVAFAAYPEDETILSIDQITIFMHEILHMYYFIDNDFNKAIYNFWNNNVSQEDKQVWIQFLDSKDYDTNYQYLVINEFYAYISQVPKEDIANYLINTNYFPKLGLNRYDKWGKKLEKLLWEKKGLISGELLVLFKDKIIKDSNNI